MNRKQLTAIVRVMASFGILLLMLAFLRACFSPPHIPVKNFPGNQSTESDAMQTGTLPTRY